MDTIDVAPQTAVEVLSDERLNELRLTGDPLADDAASFMFNNQDNASIIGQLRKIATKSSFVANDFPPYVGTFFTQALQFPNGVVPDDEKINRACNLFDRYGFHIVNILFFKSLPGGYMAPYPSKVMATTQLINTQTARRVLETAQMIFDVHKKGWYQEDGTGIMTVLKVRLMHAGMRYAIINRTEDKWDSSDAFLPPAGADALPIPQGIPINQEDQALTLNLFSVIILEGLQQLGIILDDQEKEDYLYNWQMVGHFMGIYDELMPAGVDATWALHRKMCERLYVLPNKYGPGLTTALLDVINKNTKGIISMRLLRNMTIYMLKPDNEKVCESLDFPRPSIVSRAIDAILVYLTNHAQKRIQRDRTLVEKFEKKNSYLGLLFFMTVKRAKFDRLVVAEFKMALFEKICKTILKGMQEQAVLSTNKQFFVDNRLVELWDLGGFSWDSDTEEVVRDLQQIEKVGGYVMMVAAPVVSGVAFYELYKIRIENAQPTYPLGKVNLHVSVTQKKVDFDQNYKKDMLGIGLLFLATTIMVWIGMLIPSKFKFLRYAYVLLMVALLVWVVFL